MTVSRLRSSAKPHCGSNANPITEFLQQYLDSMLVIPLNLDRIVLDRTAGTARIFESGQKIGKMLSRISFRQSPDNGDGFSFFPFFNSNLSCLFFGWHLMHLWRRTGASILQFTAFLTARWLIELCPLKESHGQFPFPFLNPNPP